MFGWFRIPPQDTAAASAALKRVIGKAVRGGKHTEKLPDGGLVHARSHRIGQRDGVAYHTEDADGRIKDPRWQVNGPRKVK